jgi:hypothetical protein
MLRIKIATMYKTPKRYRRCSYLEKVLQMSSHTPLKVTIFKQIAFKMRKLPGLTTEMSQIVETPVTVVTAHTKKP